MTPIPRVLFLGQSCAAAMPPLTALVDAGCEISAVVLARQAGARLGEIQRLATGKGIPVVWVKSAAEATDAIREAAPEVAVAACFPWRLPRAAREIPPLGILNVHPSLLPAFPGMHALEDALAAGVAETGVTVHYVDEGIDTGPVIAQEPLEIRPDDTIESLRARAHELEHRLLPEATRRLVSGALRSSAT